MKLLRPTFLFLLYVVLVGCAGLRIQQAKDDVTIVEDVPYVASSDDPKHRLDLYVPRGANDVPMVLFVHGGFWRNQDRRYFQALVGLYGNVGVALAKRGIACAVTSHRLSPNVGIHEQLDDVLAALRWLRENGGRYGGDPSRIVLVGYSSGGHLVTLLGLDPRYADRAGPGLRDVRGYVSLSGILDVPAMAAEQDETFNREVTYPLFGRTAEQQARLSPASYLRADAPPLLLLAAERDYPFIRAAAKDVARESKAMGARATFRDIKDYDHADMVTSIYTRNDKVSDLVAAFVREVSSR